jgi:sterol desaturase/sphingolipid hydroxylase (fatty acid hydroxylase superfamily)
LFGNQVRDNVFYSLVSGGLVWTGYEALTLWAFSNGIIPSVSWKEHPVYCTILLFAVIYIRETHFYWVHRLIHWKPLYKPVHALHHRNVNVGPWSGMSMHPVEHIFYLSGVLIHWVIPSHPVHAIAHLLHASISPSKGHSGYNKFVLSGLNEAERERTINAGNYLHYLHHRYFTVNFSNDAVPWDYWLGSFHDGSPEMHAKMLARRKKGAERGKSSS